MTARRTSSAEQACNDDSVVPVICLMTDAGACPVPDRTACTLLSPKNFSETCRRCEVWPAVRRCCSDVREAATSTATTLLGCHCRVKYGSSSTRSSWLRSRRAFCVVRQPRLAYSSCICLAEKIMSLTPLPARKPQWLSGIMAELSTWSLSLFSRMLARTFPATDNRDMP